MEQELLEQQETEVSVGDPKEKDLEVEIVDDTPEEDRRAPRDEKASKPEEAEVTEDELKGYSDRVQKRIKRLTYEAHEERRQKERLQREAEEAIRYAETMRQQAELLRQQSIAAQRAATQNAVGYAQSEINQAKRELAEAYEKGDAKAMADAQEKIARFSQTHQAWSSYVPPEPALPPAPQIQEHQGPSAKTKAWVERNPWFQTNEPMTALAMGVHQRLINSGADPDSDAYYEAIDKEMRLRFPEYFGQTTQVESKRSSAVPVAPVSRTAANVAGPRKVKLTATQVEVAKKLGITPEQYAKELMQMEAR